MNAATGNPLQLPGFGQIAADSGFLSLECSSNGCHSVGNGGVQHILSTGDRKVELIAYEDHTLAYVKSELGYPAYYPVYPVRLEKPVKAVLMDLDGTTVRSEDFWVWIIQLSVQSLLGDDRFEFCQADLPFVSGHSVSEHLQYCIGKYCPDKSIAEARRYYFRHTQHQMGEILHGRGRKGAFVPSPGIKDFLLDLKARGIKIGLVTSGLFDKAYPEILSAFETLGMGDPAEFYDSIVTAGYPLGRGSAGTLGELAPKPHPWLYAETCAVGLSIPFEDRHFVVGIEDSGAGVCSVRLAGFTAIGLADGNIIASGTHGMCSRYCTTFEEIAEILR